MKKALYLDDSQTSIVLAKKLLTDTVEVLSANNIPDAIELAEKSQIDLFLLDYQIGNRTSFEFADYLRKTSPKYTSTPIILVTAFRSDGLYYKASLRKINDFLHKPFEKKSLSELVSFYLDNPTHVRKFKPAFTTAQCISWKLNNVCFQYSPDLQQTISGESFEDVGKKMKELLASSKKNAAAEVEIVLHNVPFSESE